MGLIRDAIFLVLFFVFIVAWFLVWLAFHVTAGGVHVLLALAVIFLVLHFLHGRRTA